MRYSFKAIALAALAIGQVAAGSVRHSHRHAHLHKKTAELAERETAALEERGHTVKLFKADEQKLLNKLGFTSCGTNSHSSAGADVWIGKDGPYTNEFCNHSGEDIILAVWGPDGSWVNAVAPLITISIPKGASRTLSFSNTFSGAMAAIYEDTELVNGQVSNTWVEWTTGEYGTIDVSREVNMDGHNVSVVGPQCTTDMDTCVFVCPDGQTTCTYGYILKNCEIGSQPGANYGTYAGSPSGGCSGMGDSAHITTTFS